MKLFTLLLILFSISCSSNIPIDKFSEIYPGMKCADLNSYLDGQKIPYKKDGDLYRFALKGDTWMNALVTCSDVITKMSFDSKEGSSPEYSKAYISAQTSLLDAFRENKITYEEGNKIINMNNGIKLHQFSDKKTGSITHFEISVDNMEGSREAWAQTAPLLNEIGTK